MADIFEINPRRVFTLDSANELLPLVRRITSDYAATVQTLIRKFEEMKQKNHPGSERVEEEINRYVTEWQSKMNRLGIRTKGLWIADFDSGDGFFCWKFPEERVGFWHAYLDGYRGRIAVETKFPVTETKFPESRPEAEA